MGKTFNVAVMSGDGIGPEVVAQAIKVLKAVEKKYSVSFNFRDVLIGAIAIDQTGNPLPDETIKICKESDAVLLGAVGHPKFDNDPSAKVRPEQGLLKIRKELGLYANIRPVATYSLLNEASPIKNHLLKDVDMVVYRELTGGIYFGEKGRKDEGKTAYDNCIYTEAEVLRISHMAFKMAQSRKKKLTMVDKANVLESSRLWREVVKKLEAQYPDVTVDYMFVDAAAMKLVTWPAYFDVILTENMFGDILTDEASVITGSIGLLPSASMGDKYALFEPIHGSYPQAAGKNIANPYGTILSAAMLCEHLGLADAAKDIRNAVNKGLEQGVVTEDINKTKNNTTTEVGDFVAANL